MLQKIIKLLLCLCLPIMCHAQLSETNTQQLRSELAQKVNALRQSQGLQALGTDPVLQKAAVAHSQYMAGNHVLSHEQKNATTATPEKRVRVHGGTNFETVGENVLYSVPQTFPLTAQAVSVLAEQMFLSWKNSPGHYANMVNRTYELGDFGFAVDVSNNVVYATQVFGTKGAVVSGQISSNAFGLQIASESCGEAYRGFDNLVANLGNALQMEGDEVILYHHDIELFGDILKHPNDGIAVDLVSRKQLPCGGKNTFDTSPIFDGILLKPVYREALLANNRAEGNYRLITPVGHVPANLGSDYSLSVLLIQGGKVCKYLLRGEVPAEQYSLRPIEPFWLNPDVALADSGIVLSQELTYDFKTGKTVPVKLPQVEGYPYRVHSVELRSFSSVEGDSVKNAGLHHARALAVKEHIEKQVPVADSLFHTQEGENWNEMKFQFHYFFQDALAGLPHDSVKKIIAGRKVSLPWDSLLFAQRRATATVHYAGKFSEGETFWGKPGLNLRTAVALGNWPLANKAMYEIYRSQNDSVLTFDASILFENTVYEACKTRPELVQNAAALFTQVYQADIHKTTGFIFHWMAREKELSDEAKFNLLHLYTLVGVDLLDQWDVSAQRLAHVVHPNRVNRFAGNVSKSELVLNLQLTYLEYFGQVNDGPNINKSFDYITGYFKNHLLGPDDDVALALFFNRWSRYDLTIDFLLPKFREGKLNEDGLFALAQTMNFYPDENRRTAFEEVQQKAVNLNPKRWCRWANNDFQMLRNSRVKELYCKSCQ